MSQTGCATPTHYTVLMDSTGVSEEALQTITYGQCYNYVNTRGSIRVPAPLMYANKLALMVGEHIKGEPSGLLSKQLYYV